MNGFEIRWENDDRFDVYLNGKYVTHADHDLDGWAGMSHVSDTCASVAEILGLDFNETWPEVDEEV
jgi:hypothetical protein